MRLGRRLALPTVAFVLVAAAPLVGCGLLDGGSTVEDAFEVLPADTFEVRFVDRVAIAERLDHDDIDPRDASDDDIRDYGNELHEEYGSQGFTSLSSRIRDMRDAPLNDFDIEWEAHGTWGDDVEAPSGAATVWKVGDDVDFEDLVDDLEDKGYDEGEAGGRPLYSADQADIDPDTGAVGGIYPPIMLNVLLDEDEHLIAAAASADSLEVIADVIADDADSLADDADLEELVDASDNDVEFARIATGPAVCVVDESPLPDRLLAEYEDLHRPEARALLMSGEDLPEVLVVLRYDDEDDARDDLEARETLVEDGVDAISFDRFDELGEFAIERDGHLLLIAAEFASGEPGDAVVAETGGGGPGACPLE